MPLDRQYVIDQIRSTNPELYDTWDDAKIFGFIQHFIPEIKFEPETPGAASYRQYGAVEVPTFMERAAHQLETQWDDMNVGLYGMMPWNDIDAAENLRKYNQNLYRRKVADNIELQALTAWKEDEPGWTNLDTSLRSLSEAIPSLALAMTGTIIGVGLASITGGSSLAYTVASLAPMFAMESGAQYNEAMSTLVDDLGMDPEEARGYAQMTAVAYGSIASVLERIGAQHYLRLVGIGRKTSEGELRKTLAQYIVRTGLNRGKLVRGGVRMIAGAAKTMEGALIEGSTEWMQAYTQNTINEAMRLGFGEDPMSVKGALKEAFKKTWKNKAIWEEGFAGATTGILGLPFGVATSTQASKVTSKEVAELQESEKDPELRAQEVGKFGTYLSALSDVELMGDILGNIQENDTIGQRMQIAEETIGNIGKKILWVIGNNPDVIDELYNHENAEVLLAEVREVFISEGGLDEDTGKTELRAMINHYISSGKFVFDEASKTQDDLISDIQIDPTLVMHKFAEDVGESPGAESILTPTPAKLTFAELEKEISEDRKSEIISNLADDQKKPSNMTEAEKAWYAVMRSQAMSVAQTADRVPGSKWEMPSSKSTGKETKKVIAEFDKGIAAQNIKIAEAEVAEGAGVTADPKGVYAKGQIVQLNIDPSTITNKKNRKSLESLDKAKQYAVVAVSKTSIRLIELNSDGELSVDPIKQKKEDQIWVHKELYKGKVRQTDHLKIIGKGEKIYETTYETQYEKTYEDTGNIKVKGKIIETKAQTDVDQMSASQLLAKAKELGIVDQLPKTPGGNISKSAESIAKIKELIKVAISPAAPAPGKVPSLIEEIEADKKMVEAEKKAEAEEATLETDEEAVPAPTAEQKVETVVDSKGRTLIKFANTTEKDGIKTTTYTFNRSDKDKNQRAKVSVTEEAAFGDRLEIKEGEMDEFNEDSGDVWTIQKVHEVREFGDEVPGVGTAKVTLINKDGDILQDVVFLLQKKQKEQKAPVSKEKSGVTVTGGENKGKVVTVIEKLPERYGRGMMYKVTLPNGHTTWIEEEFIPTEATEEVSVEETVKRSFDKEKSESGLYADGITSEDVHDAAEKADMNIESDEFHALSDKITDQEHIDKMSNDEKGRMIDYLEDKVRFKEFEEAGEKPVKATKDNIKDFDNTVVTAATGEKELAALESGETPARETLVFVGDKPHLQDEDGVTEEISVAKAVELVNASLEAAKPEAQLTPTEESFIKVYEDNEKKLEFSGALEEENPKEASRLAKEFGYKEPTAAKQLKYEKLKEQQGLLAKPLKTTKAKPQISKEQAKEIKGLITSSGTVAPRRGRKKGIGKAAPSTKKKTAPKNPAVEKKVLSDKDKVTFVKDRLAGKDINISEMTDEQLDYYESNDFGQDFEEAKQAEEGLEDNYDRPDDGIDFQNQNSSSEQLISENKRIADRILERLKRYFPNVDVKTFEGVLEIYGIEKIGYAVEGIVGWSITDGRLDTMPHEYAHIYVKLLRNENIIKLGLKKFGTEEELVKQIGLYYTNRIQTSSMRNNIRVWLKQFVARLKKMFGVLPKNKEAVLRFIAEEFYQGRYLGMEVTVGDQWIEYEDKHEVQALDETHESEEQSEAPDIKQTSVPRDVQLSHFMHEVLGVYINTKFHYPIMMDLADKYDKYEGYEDALFKWSVEMTDKRNMKGDENLKNQSQLTSKEKNRLKNEWSRIQSRIQRFSKTDEKAQGRNTRTYLEIVLNYDEVTEKKDSVGMESAGEYDKVNEREFARYNVRNFIEDDYKNDIHDSRLMILPLKQITRRNIRGSDSKPFYKSDAPNMSFSFIESLQRKAGKEYIRKFKRQIFGIKTRAMERMEEGISEKANLEIILDDLKAMDKKGTLLSVVGSKIGDNAAIVATAVRQMPHQLTPEVFNDIIKEELDLGNIREIHAEILRRDGNYDKLKNSKNNLVNSISFNEYARDKIKISGTKGVAKPISEFFDTFERDMRGLEDMVEMSQALAQLRWWQNVRTPDYFMYEKSAGDSMVRLSINMAEGPSPLEAGDMKMIIIDEDVQVAGQVWARDDNGDWLYNKNGKHIIVDEVITDDSLVYGDFDGASFTGTRYLSKTGSSLGYNVLQQLKTFIRQRDINENKDGSTSVDYLGMKHMMFAAYKGMKFYRNGELFAEVKVDSKGLTYFEDSDGNQFDMISSPNEAKMTFGKYASSKQKAAAFGGNESDYENGYYKVHTIKASSIKATQIKEKSKWSSSYPVAWGEMLIALGVNSDEVNALLNAIRGRYVDVVNHYTDQIKSFYKDPKLLANFIRKLDKAGEVPDDLQRYLPLLGKDGMGVFHPNLITHIIPVINSKLIKDGINKGRGWEGEGTVLYIKPARNASISKHHHLKDKHVIVSADNGPAVKKIVKLIDKERGIHAVDWQNIQKHEKIKLINEYLETHEVYMLIHRNPLAKVTGPVVRRVQSLEEGLGQTTIMSIRDVKDILDGDWDGDTNAMEFASKSQIDAMLAWQDSEMFKSVDNIVSLNIFGKRVDDPTNKDTSTVLSRVDLNTEINRSSKGDGSTGVMVNGKTIMAQLFSKELVITVGKGKDAYELTAANPLSEVVMDYIKLNPDQLSKKELKIIVNNGDSIVVYKKGKLTKKTVNIGEDFTIKDKVGKDETWHLNTTKGHEMAILFQMAVDGSKFPFLGQIIAAQKVNNFQFMISRIFQKDGTDNLSKKDITFLSKVYGTQNLSRQRQGRTRSGLSTNYQINLDMSDALNKMHNTRALSDETLRGDDQGRVKGTRTHKSYAKQFADSIAHEISLSDWRNKYGMRGYGGHALADVDISIKNFITPMEGLMLMLGAKIKQSDWHHLLTDKNAQKNAHVLAMQEIWDMDSIQAIMAKSYEERGKTGEFSDAFEFLYKDRVSWIPGLADNLKETIETLTEDIDGGIKNLNFVSIWDYLMKQSADKDAIRMDTSKSFIDFVDLFIEKYISLTPEAQAWTTLEFLTSRGGSTFILKLLPLDLMSEEIIKIYLPIWEKHLRNIVGKTDAIGARGVRKGGKKGGALPYQVDMDADIAQKRKDHEKKNKDMCKN